MALGHILKWHATGLILLVSCIIAMAFALGAFAAIRVLRTYAYSF